MVSDGNCYGFPVGVACSVPVRSEGVEWHVVRDLELTPAIQVRIQWNPSNWARRKCPDYGGVLISEVEKYTNMVLGEEESVLIREVSLFQGLKSTQTWYLGRKKVS